MPCECQVFLTEAVSLFSLLFLLGHYFEGSMDYYSYMVKMVMPGEFLELSSSILGSIIAQQGLRDSMLGKD